MALSRADRLNAVLAKVAPKAHAHQKATGQWPNAHPEPGTLRDKNGDPVLVDGEEQAARHSGAPYVIETLPDGRRRVRVTSEDGDILSGVGSTIEGALAALEAKVGA